MGRHWTASLPLGIAWGVLGALSPACGERDCPSTPGRETLCVTVAGGQTGMEGTCLATPDPEPFSGEDVRALIEGAHTTTLAYRPRLRATGAAPSAPENMPIGVMVEARGEPRSVDRLGESCQLRIVQDVVVTLRFDDPALDIVIETSAHAFSSRFAVVQVELAARLAAAIGLPPATVTLALAFDSNGVRGTFDPHDGCGFAVFPAEAPCPEWSSVEVGLDRERNGFRPRDALAMIEALDDVPLRWLGGGSATTVSVALIEAPDGACSGDWLETFCPEQLHMPVTIRATIAGGSMPVELPAELSVEVSTQRSAAHASCGTARTAGEIEGFSLVAADVPMPPGALPSAIWAPENGDAAFSLYLGMSTDGTSARAEVIPLEFVNPGLTSPLDSTVEPAASRCVFSPGREYPADSEME